MRDKLVEKATDRAAHGGKGDRMSERLRPRDLAILAAESPTTPMHNATVEIFDPGSPASTTTGSCS